MNELNIQILLELVQKYDKEELKIIKKASPIYIKNI